MNYSIRTFFLRNIPNYWYYDYKNNSFYEYNIRLYSLKEARLGFKIQKELYKSDLIYSTKIKINIPVI